MRIVLINHSDTKGGASVVAYRLMKALRAIGHDAKMLVLYKGGNDPNVVLAASPGRAKVVFAAEHARIFCANGFNRNDLFKVSVGAGGVGLQHHPLVKEADAVILNWINQGMMSLREIEAVASAKPTIWTMHDMWNLTGICHHAGGCEKYVSGCGNCHFLHGRASENDLSCRIARQKRLLYDNLPIRFVAVSRWLASRAQSSQLMMNCNISVIPNAFPIDDFYIKPKKSRADIGLPEWKKLVLMGAARLDDPIKGLPYAIDILNGLNRNDFEVVFFGNQRDKNSLTSLRVPYRWLGTLNDADTLHELYAHASVVISTSLYETLPGTLVEAQASGSTPIAFDSGGQSDIIDNGTTGFLIEPYNIDDFRRALNNALDSPCSEDVLRASVVDKFSSTTIAQRYVDLIS
ncbi:MAG: glycosyltransferase [Muribaculaceae bacterium]|nr:glycosyltransferase [Muribaculaceae bacterium]